MVFPTKTRSQHVRLLRAVWTCPSEINEMQEYFIYALKSAWFEDDVQILYKPQVQESPILGKPLISPSPRWLAKKRKLFFLQSQRKLRLVKLVRGGSRQKYPASDDGRRTNSSSSYLSRGWIITSIFGTPVMLSTFSYFPSCMVKLLPESH